MQLHEIQVHENLLGKYIASGIGKFTADARSIHVEE